MMKHIILLCTYLFSLSAFAQFSISGGSGTPYEYAADASTQLDKVYIVNGLTGATLSYISESGNILFFKYDQSSNKTQIPSSEINTSISGGKTTYQLSALEDYRGYIAENSMGITLNSVWLIDYSLHPSTLSSLKIVDKAEDNECSPAELKVEKSDELFYVGSNGGKKNIDRIYTLEYKTLVWKDDQYIQKFESKENIYASTIYVPTLDDTQFTLKGDKIAAHFKLEKSVSTDTYHATQIAVKVLAMGIDKDGTESPISTTEAIGAPIDIRFYGYANEPVARDYKWILVNDRDPTNEIYRYTRDFDFTVTQAGKYTATLEVSNRELKCMETDKIQFSISESSLEIPNYLSPGSSTGGEPRVFKVKYKSLVKFKCSIFNRWGNKVYEYTDPEQGWDGKYKNSYVSPGVYFYVIDAEGSDGIRYKKGGDINILYKK